MKAVLTIFFGLILQISWGQDTINQTDSAGLKQGQWIIKNNSKRPDYSYSKDAIIEKGKYLNNKKEGLWTTYFPNGKVKIELTYKNNRPDGYCKMYYDNGCIKEEGTWKNIRWVGDYKLYYGDSCGKVRTTFKYNETGNREGKQISGRLGQKMITGCFLDSTERKNYKEVLSKANSLFVQKKYEEAKTVYSEADKICSEDEYIIGRLAYIEKLLKQK